MNFRVLLTLLLVNYLSSLFFVVLKASSLALGLALATVLSIAINYRAAYVRRIPGRLFLYAAIFSVAVILQSIYLYASYDIQKPLTAAFLPLMFVAIYFFARRFCELSPKELDITIFSFICLTIFVGWLGFSGVSKVGGYSEHAKAVAPFSEESHFALCVGLFSVAYCSVCSKWKYFFILINLLGLSVLFPSLTLLTFTVLMLVIGLARFAPGYFFVLGGIAFVLLFVGLSVLFSQVEYFSSRLTFEDTDNITTLVWLQGWDLATNNFQSTYGLGLGFQMLGSERTLLSDISYKTNDIAGNFKNLDDGGFVVAKLVAEFGVLGILLSVCYLFMLYRFLGLLADADKVFPFHGRRRDRGEGKKVMFLMALLFGYFIEMFFRGYGYFSPGAFFVVSALVSLRYLPGGFRSDAGRSSC
ncbi:hypothetical protein [Zoogloea sp. LCSB751]|uniref:hypothetical protein n=1 Tax=Zoogloea sp. LCSB751 TaxID=1965277 RepID=UPI001116080E|nr:hypothetical protein [Zoogloea sp. LCSB751]